MSPGVLERAATSLRWRTRRATAALRVLPDFLIVGAARAGTTGLYRSLCSHPDVRAPFRKEPQYFGAFYGRGGAWYRAHFPLGHLTPAGRPVAADSHARFVTGEATTSYLPDPRVPPRVRDDLPDVRLLVLLRDPVDRAHSHWRLRSAEGREHRSFAEAVRPDLEDGRVRTGLVRDTPYLAWSAYDRHLRRWYAVFPRSLIHVVISEELWADPREQHERILEFLGLPPHPLEITPRSNTQPGPPLSPTLRREVETLLAPHRTGVRALLGRDPAW